MQELREHPLEWVVAGLLLVGLLLGTADFHPSANPVSAEFSRTAENM
jgi:hypothetical protein